MMHKSSHTERSDGWKDRLIMHGLVELLDCRNLQYHVVLSCVRAPWTWGFFVCFTLCFACPMEGRDMMTISLCKLEFFVRLLCPVTCASLRGTCVVLPLVSTKEECWHNVQADGDRRGHVFLCRLVRLVLYDEWALNGDTQEQTVV